MVIGLVTSNDMASQPWEAGTKTVSLSCTLQAKGKRTLTVSLVPRAEGFEVKGILAKLDLESPQKLREGENQVDPGGHFWRVEGPMEPGPPARRLIRR